MIPSLVATLKDNHQERKVEIKVEIEVEMKVEIEVEKVEMVTRTL